MQVLRMAFLSTAVLEFFAALAIALVAVYLGLGLLGLLPWAKGEIPVPYQGALFILLLAPEFYAPLRQLGSDYHARAEARAAITELLPLLQMEVWHPAGTAHPDRPGAPTLRLRQLRVAGSDGRLRMAPLDLDVAAGQRLLVQGQSGSGKSTLLNVLLGFVPYQGEAQVYAQELADLDRTAWQVRIGYLAQQPELLAASVADNLRLAAPGASDGELWQVLEKVGLATLLRRLPLGLDTPLGERGLGLSGGEQSRLALARLLLRDASLWLLDEPLAHLDPETAEQIGALIERLSRGRTLLLVSHGSGGLDWLESVHELVPAQGQTI
jgi:ATP-binding cassette subfamily C protein CydD